MSNVTHHQRGGGVPGRANAGRNTCAPDNSDAKRAKRRIKNSTSRLKQTQREASPELSSATARTKREHQSDDEEGPVASSPEPPRKRPANQKS
ncbi:hypothetical protein N7486_010124 [Penicillium sp. IBT 16267x]|nr:hypothetical protein N7486_010124 [Penicillium sp. IBT 16267x]